MAITKPTTHNNTHKQKHLHEVKYTQLYGTGVALVTPFTASGTVDYESLTKLINYVIISGVQYVVSLGTTGEASTLTTAEKIEILNHTYNIIANRVPVVVGIGGASTQQVLADIQTLPLHGAAAILSVSPYYNKPSQQGIYAHYVAIAKASELPIILYNVPSRTGRSMEVATTLSLANACSNIIGIKEASDNMEHCLNLVAQAPKGFAVLSGDDALAPAQIALGFKGVISVIANYYAADYNLLIQHCLAYNYAAVQPMLYKLLPAISLCFAENNPAGIKEFLQLNNICHNYCRLPVIPVTAATSAAIIHFNTTYDVS